eukprot:gene19244-biopygen5952
MYSAQDRQLRSSSIPVEHPPRDRNRTGIEVSITRGAIDSFRFQLDSGWEHHPHNMSSLENGRYLGKSIELYRYSKEVA